MSSTTEGVNSNHILEERGIFLLVHHPLFFPFLLVPLQVVNRSLNMRSMCRTIGEGGNFTGAGPVLIEGGEKDGPKISQVNQVVILGREK